MLAVAGCTIAVVPPAGAEQARPFGDTRLFAVVPAPGSPEGIEVSSGLVVVGTTDSALDVAGGGPASKLFGFDPRDASLVTEQTAVGEDRSRLHGLTGMARDAEGRLYVGEVTSGVLRMDPRAGTQETYAAVPDLPACLPLGATTGCSPTVADRTPLPNDLEFDAAGNLYVSDSFQATVFRVRPGSSRAEPWFSDPRLDGAFGVNGLRVSPDGRWLHLVVTGDLTQVSRVYRLPLVEAPTPDQLVELWSEPGAGADGLAIGRSGQLYVALGQVQALLVLAPDGREVTRITAAEGAEPLREPASVVFAGDRLLVTNHAFGDGDVFPEHATVVDVQVAERGWPRPRPTV